MNSVVAALALLLSLEQIDDNAILHVEPPRDHHMNTEAPNSLTDASGTKAKKIAFKESMLTFDASTMKRFPVTVTAYLCDDKNTYCVKKTAQLQSFDNLPRKKTQIKTPTTKSSKKSVKQSLEDFYLNDETRALQEAKEKKRPLLIDFFGIWCPPCNLLDAEIFSHERFKEAYAGFVKLKMDADASTSWNLKSRYKVTGYPTVVFADSNGNELGRFIGYYPLESFVAVANAIVAGKKFPKIAEPTLEYDVVMQKASEAEKNGNLEGAKKLWNESAELLKKKLSSSAASNDSLERSVSTDLAHALYKSGRTAEAEKLYRRMQKKYPKEFTYLFYHARMLNDAGKFAEAEKKARSAFRYSYGDNRLRAADVLATALIKQKNTAEAKKLLSDTLRSAKLPTDPEIRTHRYIQKLRTLLTEIDK